MNLALYWILSLSWGLPLNLAGLFVALGLLLTGHRGKWTRYGPVFPVTRGTGVSFGWVVICDGDLTLLPHERGHSLQNVMLGPFMIPLVAIPSVLRFWYRRRRKTAVPYDAVWFEGMATSLGKRLYPSP